MPRLPDVNDLGARPVPQSRRNVVSVRNAGAMGGKILGAGGGGFFLFYTPFMKKGKVTEALEALGAQPVPVILDHAGMQVWEVVEQDLSSESEGLFGAHSG